MMVEAGIMIALAYVLSMVKIFEGPYGGSVTAGSMVPILIYAIRWGGVQGLVVSIVYGGIQFILGPKWSFHPVSIICDYALGFGVLGVAGFFGGDKIKEYIGIGVAVTLRFIMHVVSGVVVFASFAPEEMSPLKYSMLYNAGYLIPELIISILVFTLMKRYLKGYL